MMPRSEDIEERDIARARVAALVCLLHDVASDERLERIARGAAVLSADLHAHDERRPPLEAR